MLLVFDNFEQVTAAAPTVAELLRDCPELKQLVTSREALNVTGEQVYAVPPLDLPDPRRLPDLHTLGEFEAVRLFTERARTVRPAFQVTDENAQAVAEITARLAGLPLAIELAATRTKVLTPEQMLPRLRQRLALLTSGARTLPDRQGPSATRSPGATTCWRRPSNACSPGCRCSAGAGRWTRRTRCATQGSSAWSSWRG